MSERKVLNKYYPPDFDPSKIPRMKLARNRQYTVRLMAPFNMRCKTCGEYIYKGKKFNARKEDVEGDDYLGIRIYRFYIKCTRCLQEISFKTDPKNTDYEIEAGATRNFMALKLAEEQAQREEDEEKEEEATNPMKLLEKRTQQSKQELELLESLEELKDLNRRQQTINYDQMLEQYDTEGTRQRTLKEQEELDEQYVKEVFAKKKLTGTVVEEEIIEIDEKSTEEPPKKIPKSDSNKEKNVSTNSEKNTNNSSQSCSQTHVNPIPAASLSKTEDTRLKTNKRDFSGFIKKKIDLGVKINTQAVDSKVSNNEKKESVPQENKSDDDVTSNTKTTTSESTSNSLSLLGAYSGSSDNDSD